MTTRAAFLNIPPNKPLPQIPIDRFNTPPNKPLPPIPVAKLQTIDRDVLQRDALFTQKNQLQIAKLIQVTAATATDSIASKSIEMKLWANGKPFDTLYDRVHAHKRRDFKIRTTVPRSNMYSMRC